jgi:hypothetical protein
MVDGPRSSPISARKSLEIMELYMEHYLYGITTHKLHLTNTCGSTQGQNSIIEPALIQMNIETLPDIVQGSISSSVKTEPTGKSKTKEQNGAHPMLGKSQTICLKEIVVHAIMGAQMSPMPVS